MATTHPPILDRALSVVCAIWGMTPEDITGPGRDQWRSEARFVVMSLLVSERVSQTHAAVMVGRRRNGLSHQLQSMQSLMDSDPQYKARVELARAQFKASQQ